MPSAAEDMARLDAIAKDLIGQILGALGASKALKTKDHSKVAEATAIMTNALIAAQHAGITVGRDMFAKKVANDADNNETADEIVRATMGEGC